MQGYMVCHDSGWKHIQGLQFANLVRKVKEKPMDFRNFPTGGLTLPTRELKYSFQGAISTKNLQKNRFSPSDRELACSNRGL